MPRAVVARCASTFAPAVEQRDPASAGSDSSRRGSRPVAMSTFSAVTLPPIQEISVPPGTSRAAIRRAPVTTRTPSSLQHAQQRLARLGLLAAQRRVAAQHERDLDAEAVQRLRELHRDRPGAADRERAREVGQAQEVVAREERRALHAGDRGDPRARAHREHGRDAPQHRLAAPRRDDERAVAKAPLPAHAQDAVALEQLLVEAPPVVDHLVHARHDRRARRSRPSRARRTRGRDGPRVRSRLP